MWTPLLLLAFACVPSTVGGSGDDGDSGGAWDGGADGGSALAGIDTTLLPAGADPCREPVLVTVDWVVDGDTAYVNGPDGDEKVRFIGVDTPEVSYEGSTADCYGEDAYEYTKDALEGEEVWLTFDGECVDYYDRTLAYVNTGVGEQDLFERRLLRGGWARTLAIEPNTSFEATFDADQDQAEDDNAGGWDACGW